MKPPLEISYRLVLGSGSPRRKALLESLGLSFEVRVKETTEDFPDGLGLHDIPEYLAFRKAQALKADLAPDELVITADTVVLHRNEILGKPQNRNAAIGMLEKLSGTEHTVVTGICLMNQEFERTFREVTSVRFHPLNAVETAYYIDRFQPFDKAGSYGIQEWLGLVGVAGIDGCYYNVVGLPVSRLYQELKKIG